MVHEDYKEMIPARALSALDPAEARALNEHLDNCSECRKELAEWEATAAALAVVADPAEPSPKVRERILDEIRNEGSAEVIPFRSTSRNIWKSFGSLGAMAAVVLFTALIVGLVVLWRQNRAAQAELAAATAQLEAAQKDVQRSNEFLQLVLTSGAKVTELAGTGDARGASAKLAYDKAGRALLIARGLPSVPQGKEYQLWFILPGKSPMPGKSFAADTTGSASSKDQMPEAAAQGSAVFAITVEPKGGSVSSPTGSIVLRSEL
jgi:anti-sigma-K factor RskA